MNIRVPAKVMASARKNQQWYLGEKKKRNLPWWHHHCRSPQQYSEYVLLTPAMVKELLACLLPTHRALSAAYIQRILKSIKEDGWQKQGPMASVDSGNLVDGYHTLKALEAYGKSYPVLVTFNATVNPLTGQAIPPPPPKAPDHRSIDDPWDV